MSNARNLSNFRPSASGQVETADIADAAVTAGKLDTGAAASNLGNYVSTVNGSTGAVTVQPTLVSGTNIKTVNGSSVLGSGDLVIDALPSQTGNSGKYLTTDGTNASWATIPLPSEIITPTNTSPANGATGQTETPTLTSSTYYSLYGYSHAASQWQVSTSSGFGTTVVNTGDDASNKTSYTISAGVLSVSTTYYWRVRYKDSNGTYSEWSTATTFTTAASFSYSIEVLRIAGGGSGGAAGGGGGAGGMLVESRSVTPGTGYSVGIGGGGTGVTYASDGNQGGSTTFTGMTTCVGGGRGVHDQSSADGGSGGGRGYGASSGGNATSGQGSNGGWGGTSGGTGGNGGSATSAYSTWASATSSGVSGAYAGGGGGGDRNGSYPGGGGGGKGGTGGNASGSRLGGGGGAGNGSGDSGGQSATANTGSGGGACSQSGTSGNGGSGLVIVRYTGSQKGSGGTVYSSGGYTYHKFTGNGTFTA